MIEDELEMAITLSVRRNWNAAACDYVENCSDKDIALFLNAPIEFVIRVRQANYGPTRAELAENIEQAIVDDLTIIKRMLDAQEIIYWVEQAKVHLRNMQGNLTEVDEILTKIHRCARSGNSNEIISLCNNQFAELKSCFQLNLENTVFVRSLYRNRFRQVDEAINHIDQYLIDISDFGCEISDVLDDRSAIGKVLAQATPSQLKAGYRSPFSADE